MKNEVGEIVKVAKSNFKSKRYRLESGKFGAYFRDTERSVDLSLNEVEYLLNKSNTVGLYKEIIGSIRQCVPVGCDIDNKMNEDLDFANAQ